MIFELLNLKISINDNLYFLISHLSEGFCVYFMQLVELALIMPPNSMSPKIEHPTPMRWEGLWQPKLPGFQGSVAEGAKFFLAWLDWFLTVEFQWSNCLLWILHAQWELNNPQKISQYTKDVDTHFSSESHWYLFGCLCCCPYELYFLVLSLRCILNSLRDLTWLKTAFSVPWEWGTLKEATEKSLLVLPSL